MRAYGVYPKDQGCCPRHDKFPRQHAGTKPRQNRRRHRQQQARKTRARMLAQQAIRVALQEPIL